VVVSARPRDGEGRCWRGTGSQHEGGRDKEKGIVTFYKVVQDKRELSDSVEDL
jgi:hypothetical protein